MSEEKKYCKVCNTELEIGSRVSVSEDNPEPYREAFLWEPFSLES